MRPAPGSSELPPSSAHLPPIFPPILGLFAFGFSPFEAPLTIFAFPVCCGVLSSLFRAVLIAFNLRPEAMPLLNLAFLTAQPPQVRAHLGVLNLMQLNNNSIGGLVGAGAVSNPSNSPNWSPD